MNSFKGRWEEGGGGGRRELYEGESRGRKGRERRREEGEREGERKDSPASPFLTSMLIFIDA